MVDEAEASTRDPVDLGELPTPQGRKEPKVGMAGPDAAKWPCRDDTKGGEPQRKKIEGKDVGLTGNA